MEEKPIVTVFRERMVSICLLSVLTAIGFFSLFGEASLHAQTVPAGLVAGYGLNEGAGSTVWDISGNSNTGTISGATWTTSGQFGNALSFNGSSGRVDIGDDSTLDLTTGMTLEAWVYPTSATGWRTVMMKEAYTFLGGYTYALYANNNASRPAVYARINGVDRYVTGTAALPTNTWTHLAATYNGTSLILYVNGSQVGSLAVSGSIGTSSNSLRVGGSTTLSGRYFSGRIDEVRTYNRALTQTDIQSDMNTAVPSDTTPPTAPSNLVASDVSSSQINLSWGVSADSVGVTGYQVERCQGVGCSNFALLTTVTGTTFNNTGLPQVTTYNYRVRATDARSNLSDYSNTASATTRDGSAPSTPTGLTASVISDTQINLSWAASTDNVGVTGYQVLRCQGTTCTPSTVLTTVTEASFSNTGLLPGTGYRYGVRATDAAGNLSSPSSYVVATTLPDTTPPTVPTNLTATALSSGTQINLSWTASTDNAAVTGYRIERCQGAGCTTFAQIGTSTGTAYSSTGLTNATAYSYRVRATDARSNLSDYSTVVSATTPDTAAPSTPAGVTASAVSDSQINLAWTASTDNVGVTGYQIQRCQGSGTCTPSTVIATVTGVSFSNTNLAPSTIYRYRLRATDAAGNYSSYSSTVTATTPQDATPPSAPLNLTATAVGGSQINLSWSASTDNGGVTGYRIERCQGAGCTDFAQIGTSTGTTYGSVGLQEITTYTYRVRATDARSNLSDYSNTASTTTLDATPPTTPTGLTATSAGSSQISLLWSASTDNVGVTGYQVLRCQGTGCTPSTVVATATGTTYQDSGLLGSTSYNYRVRATDARANLSGYSSAATATTMKPASVVLVNSQSDFYADFQHFIKPYLDNFGIPYNVIDIATTAVPVNIGDAAVIIIGHRELDANNSYLSSTEQGYMSTAVNAGTGLVNFDNALDDNGTPRYNYVQTIFNFGYGGETNASGVTFTDPTSHYITQKHSSGDTVGTWRMTVSGITVPPGVVTLATSLGTYAGANEPFLSVAAYGGGRAVQWGSYDWMSHDVRGPLLGLDDLVWRSIVWAARKPFVMQGMPPFVTMRMDDVTNPSWWVPTANDFGFVPWMGVFTDNIDDGKAVELSKLVNSGKATVGMHAFGQDNFFYFDHNNARSFSDATMASHYATATSWFNAHSIPISKYVVPHYYEIGSNAFSGLQAWGSEFVGTMMDPGGLEADAPWMMKGPYRSYESGAAYDRSHNPYYADYMTIPDHPELDRKFFSCVSEIRDVTGYEWLGNGRNGINVAIQDGTEWLKRGFDSMSLATLYSHEYTFMGFMSQSDWRAVVQGITNAISPYDPMFVSMDYACQYVRAKYNSRITAYGYNPATQQVTTTFGGYTDMPTKFYLFSETGGNIQQTLVDVPQFSLSTEVVASPPPPDTMPPAVVSVFPTDGASDVGAVVNITITFSERMDPATITVNAFDLRDSSDNPVPVTVTYNGAAKTATLGSGTLLMNSTNYRVKVKGGSDGVKDASGNTMAGDFAWTFTTEQYTEVTIWDDGVVPLQGSITDGQPIEVGVKFRSGINGYITGLRFYKGLANTGAHVGNLWHRNGALLGSVAFSNETASGWQEAYFAVPVQIQANTTYVASYYSPSGYFTVDEGYFSTGGVDSGPIHALGDGVDGPNGVYRYGASGFPALSYNASNYWVDVFFATVGPQDTTPPNVYSVVPTNNASDRKVDANLTVTFSEPINGATINTGTFELRDSFNVLVPAVVTYDASAWTATLDPVYSLANSTTYKASVRGGSFGVQDTAGNALVGDFTWSFTTARLLPPPNQGPGGPILVITSTSNRFSEYYAEILRAEGLNSFALRDISQVTPSFLSGYDVAILGEMSLTAAHVTMLSDWVTGGGNLIAMRPDIKLTSLLGLSYASSSLSDAYLFVDTASGPGKGIVQETIQFHGTADLHNVTSASKVASLYSNASAATSWPAVTLRAVGANGGQAAAFTYDLAKSVVYTRQGNPAWAGQERDGIEPIRSDDLFFGAATGDSRPDWVDLNKVAIPQADEQQRLLANLIIQMNMDKRPLPRFWYFPRMIKAVVVMTGDDHGAGGTPGRFDRHVASSSPGCSVVNWECVRSTSYVEGGAVSQAQVAGYEAEGFEVGVHIDTGCTDWTPASLQATYADQLGQFSAAYPLLSQPVTNRAHCVVWSDYDTQPQVEFANGIRFDTNYYYWPGSWISNRPGMFTGSGMPMRFAKADGTLIDVYQATTQMTDESDQVYPFTVDELLDKAIGPEGYYGAFTVNMHTDVAGSYGSDAIVASSQAREIPVVSARQMLDWLDGRNESSIGSVYWTGNMLSLVVSVAQNANGLTAMVPIPGSLVVDSVSNGSAVAHTVVSIKGMNYVVFPVVSGAYQIEFSSDNTLPTVSEVWPTDGTVGASTRSSVFAVFNEPVDAGTITSNTFELRDSSGTLVSATVSYDPATKTAKLDPTTSLKASATYMATVIGGMNGVRDLSANPMNGDKTWSFATSDTQEYSFWNDTALPSLSAVSDGQAISVGVKFRTDLNGYITGVRFYKGVLNIGTHVAGLWDMDGTLLAEAIFTNETASGWQEVTLPTQVPIAANTTYVVSYFSPSGYFAMDQSYFALAGDSSGPLHALADGADGGNGVYGYGGGFPSSSFNGSNYWVDVVFEPDTTSPTVYSVSPANGSSGHSIGTSISAIFSEAMDHATVNSGSFELRDSASVPVPATVSYDVVAGTATLDPTNVLAPSATYTATIKGGQNGVRDLAGNPINTDVVWSFTTSQFQYTIWNGAVVPGQYEAVSDGVPISIGVKFRSDVNGYVTGLRFYKGAPNTGTHVGKLWTINGTLLASTIFTAETVSGWQEASFATPVPIEPNTTYVVSYYSSSGYFAMDAGYFVSAGVDNGPLHILADGVDGGNGVYVYGDGFPASTYGGSNYWVDVVFTN